MSSPFSSSILPLLLQPLSSSRDDSELGDSMTLEDRGPGAKMELEGDTEMSPNFSVMMLENREFHNPALPVH